MTFGCGSCTVGCGISGIHTQLCYWGRGALFIYDAHVQYSCSVSMGSQSGVGRHSIVELGSARICLVNLDDTESKI